MFGLEKQQKGKDKNEEFVFELENELKDRNFYAKTKERMESRIKLVKDALRSGDSKGEFDKYGMLLHGYTSFLKVMARVKGKS